MIRWSDSRTRGIINPRPFAYLSHLLPEDPPFALCHTTTGRLPSTSCDWQAMHYVHPSIRTAVCGSLSICSRTLVHPLAHLLSLLELLSASFLPSSVLAFLCSSVFHCFLHSRSISLFVTSNLSVAVSLFRPLSLTAHIVLRS